MAVGGIDVGRWAVGWTMEETMEESIYDYGCSELKMPGGHLGGVVHQRG